MLVVLKNTQAQVNTDPWYKEDKDRWFMVVVQSTLFEAMAVVCYWGDCLNDMQGMRILPARSKAAAMRMASAIVTDRVDRRIKDMLKLFLANADTGILNTKTDMIAVSLQGVRFHG